MREKLVSERRNGRQFGSRLMLLLVLSTAGIAWSESCFAQAAPPTIQPPVGMQATSPLTPRAMRPAGIALGSTEIAVPGISPIAPLQQTGTITCADPAGSSDPPFDGGGMPASAQLPCADSQNISSPLPSPSSIGRSGIPLGSTELRGAGISPVAPMAVPLSGANPAVTPGNP